jgi:hypothetical protein
VKSKPRVSTGSSGSRSASNWCREEFESLQTSLKQARAIQEKLEARIAELESQAANRGKAKTIHSLSTETPVKAARRIKKKN